MSRLMTPDPAPSANDRFTITLATVPKGRWAVGVSGGADSVALLLLLRKHRPDLSIHIVHLDHETRNGASAEDARFVSDLAARLAIPFTTATRSDVESELQVLEGNISARFRAARLALFSRVVRASALDGVILAHHADDQAETILHRLLRGSGPSGLVAMSPRTRVRGLLILRPLLKLRSGDLRTALREAGQTWREDVSNDSDAYLRNRLRRLIANRPRLTDSLLRLSTSCGQLRDWLHAHAPAVQPALEIGGFLKLPSPLQRQVARYWLAANGVPESRLDPVVVARLITMAEDLATPARHSFPGGLFVRRRRGALIAERIV
jgi:tRNA(Ile)-lysidine synthase